MRIHELKRDRAALIVKASALTAKAEAADGEMTPEDATSFDDVMAQVASLDKRVARLEQLADAEADSAVSEDEVDAKAAKLAPRGKVFAEASKMVATVKGDQAARYILGRFHARKMGNAGAAEFIQEKFGDTEVAKALNSSTGTAGQDLIPTSFSTDWIELLRPMVAVRNLNPIIMPLGTGNLTIPRLTAGSTAQYQGEMTPITASQQVFDQLILSARKLTAFVPVTNDLLRRSPIGVEALIRDDMLQVIARRSDLAFLRGDGSSGSPTGLLSLTPSGNKLVAAGVTTAQVISLVTSLIAALQNGNSRMQRPGWVFNPTVMWFLKNVRDSVGGFMFKTEMDAGSFYGYPYVTTTAIPNNLTTAGGTAGSEIYLADFGDVIIGETFNLSVEASDVASYVDSGGTRQDAFQSDQTVFRVITEHDFNARHLASLAIGLVDSWH